MVAGGGLGGVAAALSATAMGAHAVLVEETDWLGGQATSQGVSALDEHRFIEAYGATARYTDFRERIRLHYRTGYDLSDAGCSARYLNPGSADPGRRFAFEPAVGASVLAEMVRPPRESGLLEVAFDSRVVGVECKLGRITQVSVLDRRTGRCRDLAPECVVDATELGDILPLAGAPYRTGVESHAETGEPSAPVQELRAATQAITFTFAVEMRPGESHVISRPPQYDELLATHGFTFNGFRMFEPAVFGRSFWEYRRILDARNFTDPRVQEDVSLVNWVSTEYHEETLIDQPEETVPVHLDRARQLALSFLFWLQTEAPRDDGGTGYPELKLRPDIMGTPDGLAKYPYIRESRRLMALHTVREQDVTAAYNPGARARLLPDACALGFYYRIDIHRCCHTRLRSGSGGMLVPFQIPLGALLSGEISNLIAGAKNIGTTHITNGACRYHPIEWSIGEAAGTLAGMSALTGIQPAAVCRQQALLQRYQLELLRHGAPLFWFCDLPHTHPAFVAASFLAVQGIIGAAPAHLHFYPDRAAAVATADAWVERARRRYRLRRQVALALREACRGATHAECAIRLLGALGRPLALPGETGSSPTSTPA